MNGVEFQLGHNDHKVVEDFLARGSAGVAGLTLSAKHARHGKAAAEVARELGLPVRLDPATERLTEPGFSADHLPYVKDRVYDVEHLSHDQAARARLIDEVLDAHPDFVTTITPPHFLITDPRSAALSASLAADTVVQADRPVRPVLWLANGYANGHAAEVADLYSAAGITDLELRLTPFGGEDVSLPKLRRAFAALEPFHRAGLRITLGWSGALGEVAVAMGLAVSYSVGVTTLESSNHAALLGRQKVLLKQKNDPGVKRRGGQGSGGVYLPGLGLTVSSAVASQLLAQTDLRLRLQCRRGACASSLDGPLADPRGHYLHSRAGDMAQLQEQPAPRWRVHTLHQRAEAALTLRERVNQHYLEDNQHPLKTRTLQSVLALTGDAETATGSQTA